MESWGVQYLSLLAVFLCSQAAWAGCGPRTSDPNAINIILGLLLLFLVSGPIVGTVFSEITLRMNGRPRKWLRVLVSLIGGGVTFAICAPVLFGTAGSLGFCSPLLAGAGSFAAGLLYERLTAPSNQVEYQNEIGFEGSNPRIPR